MNAIRLEINTGTKESPHWEDAFLSDDVSFSIEETSIVFGDNDVFSQGLELPIEPNLHIFGNSAELHGDSIYQMLYGKQFRLWVCGVLFKTGVIILDDEIDIDDDSVEIELHSSQRKNLDELLEGVNARDVEIYREEITDPGILASMKEDERRTYELVRGNLIQIGHALPERWEHKVNFTVLRGSVARRAAGHKLWESAGTEENPLESNVSVFLPKIMVPNYYDRYGQLLGNFVNDSKPYPAAPYCNVRVCSQKYIPGGNNQWDKKRGIVVGGPDRVNSSPCFYVMFWLERLFDLLHVEVVSNDMYNVPDLSRLAFMHSDCRYKTEPAQDSQGGTSFSCGESDRNYVRFSIGMKYGDGAKGNISYDGYGVQGVGIPVYPKDGDTSFGLPAAESRVYGKETTHTIDVYRITNTSEESFTSDLPGTLCKAYATSDNFPDVDAMEIIHAIEAGFNMKFWYDDDTNTLRVISVKDVITRTDSVPLRCVMSDVYKRENHITGFRLKYKSANEISRNAITKLKERTQGGDETTYNYNDFRMVSVLDGYEQIYTKVSCYDETLFVDRNTGNTYRIKVDKDATKTSQWYPSLIEVWGYRDVEIGDCSDDNEDFVHTVEIGFSPVIENETNYNVEKRELNTKESIPAILCDCELHISGDEHSFVPEQYETSVGFAELDAYEEGQKSSDKIPSKVVHKCVDARFTGVVESQLSWELNGEQSHPYDDCDFGFTLGVLRDSTSIGGLDIFNNNYDNEGNSEWKFTSESKGDFTSDSVNVYGEPLCTHAVLDVHTYEDIVSRLNAELGRNLTVQDLFPIMADSVSYWLNQSGVTDLDGKVVFGGVYPISYNGAHTLWFFSNRRATSYNDDYIDSAILKSDGDGLQGTTPEEILSEMKANDWAGLLAGSYKTRAEAEAAARRINAYAVRDGVQELGLSLKLQAEKYNPDSKDKVNNTYGDYPYPISADCAKRGIYDKFYAEFAHFIINRNIAVITIERGGIELADVLNLDWCQKYTIGDYCGWLGKVTYELDRDGLGQVQIELYYL